MPVHKNWAEEFRLPDNYLAKAWLSGLDTHNAPRGASSYSRNLPSSYVCLLITLALLGPKEKENEYSIPKPFQLSEDCAERTDSRGEHGQE